MHNGPADAHRSGPDDGRGNGAEPGPWLQRAGFSVFFDVQLTEPGGAGELHRRTRLYRRVGHPTPGTGDGTVSVELKLRVTGMAELNRTSGAKVVGVLFGPEPR